jgi:hypothetical protein
MEPKPCWCCGALLEPSRREDGVCGACGPDDTPALELTDAGRLVADHYRHAETLVEIVSGEGPGVREEPLPVW